MTTPVLKNTLQDDLTHAIRARDELRSATLRLALTAVKSAEVAGPQARDLSDEEVLMVLASQAKRRREAATAYSDAGRPERAERELAELAVLADYLPRQLPDSELRALVSAAVVEIANQGVTGMAAMGRVIKLVSARASGRAEGGRIAAEVKRVLGA